MVLKWREVALFDLCILYRPTSFQTWYSLGLYISCVSNV